MGTFNIYIFYFYTDLLIHACFILFLKTFYVQYYIPIYVNYILLSLW